MKNVQDICEMAKEIGRVTNGCIVCPRCHALLVKIGNNVSLLISHLFLVSNRQYGDEIAAIVAVQDDIATVSKIYQQFSVFRF